MSRPASTRASLIFLALTLLGFLAASSAPTPLYHLYQEQLQFSPAVLTLIFGVYAFSLLAALLTVGSLSDYLGRKPVIFVALLLNMLAMLLFISADSVAWLISARLIQGFATGMATSVLGAALLDFDRRQGPLITSVAPLLGMACGALGCGLLAEFAPLPLQLTYWLLLGLFLAQAVYLWRLAESVSPQPRCLAVPAANPACAAPGAASLVAGPATGPGGLGRGRFLLVTGTVPGASGNRIDLQPDRWRAGGGVDPQRRVIHLPAAQPGGRQDVAPLRELLVVGLALVLAAVHGASLPLFFIGTLVTGSGFGAGFLGALRSIMPLALPHERAGLMSAFYVLSYLAFSLPSLLAGNLTRVFGLIPTTDGYGAVLIVLCVVALLGLRQSMRPISDGARP